MKITLCGSTRFKEQFEEINNILTLAGHVVYTVASFNESGKTDEEKNDIYDLVHQLKILNSDAIFVIDRKEFHEQGYVGRSTKREMDWARLLNKKIYSGLRDLNMLKVNV